MKIPAIMTAVMRHVTKYSKIYSEFTVQKMMTHMDSILSVYGFRCNEMQRIDEQIGRHQHFLFFPLLIYTRPRMQALRFIHLSCTNNGHYHSRYFIRRLNWPRDHCVTANNCLRIMVCSCALRCEVVLLRIILLVRSWVTCSELKLKRGQVSHLSADFWLKNLKTKVWIFLLNVVLFDKSVDVFVLKQLIIGESGIY